VIEIQRNDIKIRDIEKLLVGNPIDAIFESLTKIWDTNTSKNYYYTKGEKLSSKFEQQIYKIFPEVYDVIIHNSARNSKIQDVLNKDRFCLIIMDGMSLRESNFIINDLKRFGEVEYSYAYSAIPSETEFFTRKNFGALSPSHIKTNGKYVFFHMKRVNEIEDISTAADKLVIWSIYPDQMFEEFKVGFETKDLNRVGEETRNILLKILSRLTNHNEITITSDHGYFVDTFSWKGLSDFPSGDRYSHKVPEYLKKYCKYAGEYWVLVGRYNTIKRGKYMHVRHGGLSFLETIVPFIKIKRSEGE